MPEQYDNTNRGALFKNDRKETDKQPDYTGKINVKGTEQRLAGWIRQSKSGQTYLSIEASDPLPEGWVNEKPADKPEGPSASNQVEDDIPF